MTCRRPRSRRRRRRRGVARARGAGADAPTAEAAMVKALILGGVLKGACERRAGGQCRAATVPRTPRTGGPGTARP
jgi:hypothetical protein